ncbi:zinc finger, CCHC-type containing protein [Tanacetum coccineum]
MGNESTALVHGRGCVDLKFSSGKIVLLFNVLQVPNIRKNLISSSVLNNYVYKQVIESNKFILSKHGVFIGFGYLSNQMFRLNIVNDNIASAFMSTYKLNDSILWHARLGHVHFKRMQGMSKDRLIPAFDMDIEKCKTCMLNKITKKPFQNVKRETKVLELIHSDLCDMHATPSLRNKKYFVTFIDDASRFCYVYLLHTKDEALDKFKVFKTKVELQQGSLIKRFRTDRGGLSQGFWSEAMLTACYLLNMVPNKRIKITPYELWTKRKPKYAEHSKAFMFYVIEPNDSVLINSIIESMYAIFDENRFSSVPRSSLRIPNGTEDISGSLVPKEVTKEMDMKTTFFNGDLDGEQTPKQWHQKFNEVVLSNGYLLNQADKCVYSKFDESGKEVIICLYVDDMLIFGTGQVQVELINKFLSLRFSMKNMGEADVILVSTPMYTSEKVMPNNGQVVSQLKYFKVIGCLMYVMTCIRPDIAFVVGKLSSAATLAKAYSQMYNGKSRHLGFSHNMIRKMIMNGVISVEFVRSQQNLADYLTKGLARDLVIKPTERMRFKSECTRIVYQVRRCSGIHVPRRILRRSLRWCLLERRDDCMRTSDWGRWPKNNCCATGNGRKQSGTCCGWAVLKIAGMVFNSTGPILN